MAENVTIARPYAEAAFQYAREQNVLASWSAALEHMAAIVLDTDMQRCLGDPHVLPAETVQLLTQLFLGITGVALSAEQQNFIQALVNHERLSVLPEICTLFLELRHYHEGIKEALITSAFPLDKALLDSLVVELESYFKGKIQATVKLDPELIGGVKIAVGDQVIDASVRGKLAAMATALQN